MSISDCSWTLSLRGQRAGSRCHGWPVTFYRGWKSNDKHRTCGIRIRTTRFVLPGHQADSWVRSPRWQTQQLLADFDKVFAMLDGKREPPVSLGKVFAERYADLCNGQRVSASYFDVRYYPGVGTIHFFARDKSLVDRLNRIVGRRRQWLPPEGAKVPEAFWLQFDMAEKIDKEVRAAVRQASPGRWNDPIREFMRMDNDSAGSASASLLAGAIDQVLVARGVTLAVESGQGGNGHESRPLLTVA